jgi:2,3-bisphosphoglycerate-independent phosphoglycerate mutase
MPKGPVVLCILDGVGWGRRDDGDAVFLAKTPNLDRLSESAPWTLLAAHGTSVGMPSDADMGNSEVGHNAMGAGRIFDQGAKLVSAAIESGRIWESEAWKRATKGNTLHLIGLVSDGNVHSHVQHLEALITRASEDGVKRLRVHGMTDGRDVAARSALTWFEPIEALLHAQPGDYAFGSGGGRMHITMDRYEADWSMVERGWKAHTRGQGRRFTSACEAIRTLYAEDGQVDDQYLPEFVVGDHTGINDGDAVILFNFRGDRAVELCQAFDKADFSGFDRGVRPEVFFAGMMQYDGDLHIPQHYLVQPPVIENTVAEQLQAAGLQTMAISETQKFGHVTYFFNGNRGERPEAETWDEIPSLNVPFDQAPHMCASPVTKRACSAIRGGNYDHVRINLANGDMVGHTGNLEATIEAITYIDACVGDLIQATEQAGGVLLVTADHGNADQMFSLDKKTGGYAESEQGVRSPHTSHSLNPVPIWIFDPTRQHRFRAQTGPTVSGCIAQIGGTLLHLFRLPLPVDYLPSLLQD